MNPTLENEQNLKPAVEPLYGVRELAAYLGVPPSTIYYWKGQGKISLAVSTGKHLKFFLSQVLTDLGRVVPAPRSPSCNSLGNILDSYGLNRSLKTRGKKIASSE